MVVSWGFVVIPNHLHTGVCLFVLFYLWVVCMCFGFLLFWWAAVFLVAVGAFLFGVGAAV